MAITPASLSRCNPQQVRRAINSSTAEDAALPMRQGAPSAAVKLIPPMARGFDDGVGALPGVRSTADSPPALRLGNAFGHGNEGAERRHAPQKSDDLTTIGSRCMAS